MPVHAKVETIELLYSRIKRLEDWIKNKGGHTGDCYGHSCFCGYSALIEDREMNKEERKVLREVERRNKVAKR